MQSPARTLNPWLFSLAVLAAAGLALSIASHVAAILSKPGPLGKYTWTLHLGALVISVPAALVARRLMRRSPANQWWKALLAGCPAWTRYVLYGFITYAIVNFVIFMFTHSKDSGSGVMTYSAVRGFSGHWMAIYAVALAVLYSGARETRVQK